MVKNLFLIFGYILCVTTAQLILKSTMSEMFNARIDLNFIYTVFKNPRVLFGLFLYSLSFIIWIIVLSRVEITYAYPLLSLSVVLVAVVSWTMLGETFNISRLAGIMLTIVGAWLVIQS